MNVTELLQAAQNGTMPAPAPVGNGATGQPMQAVPMQPIAHAPMHSMGVQPVPQPVAPQPQPVMPHTPVQAPVPQAAPQAVPQASPQPVPQPVAPTQAAAPSPSGIPADQVGALIGAIVGAMVQAQNTQVAGAAVPQAAGQPQLVLPAAVPSQPQPVVPQVAGQPPTGMAALSAENQHLDQMAGAQRSIVDAMLQR